MYIYRRNDVENSVQISSGWARLIKDAGEAGLRGENCNVLYRACDTTPDISSLQDKKKRGINKILPE